MSRRYILRIGVSAIPIGSGSHVLGRSGHADVEIDDELVSRKHAALHVSESGIALEDLGSRNGTSLDGVRVGARVEVQHGQVIGIGNTRIIVLDAQRRDGARTERALQPAQRARDQRTATGETKVGPSLGALVFRALEATQSGDAAAIEQALEALSERLVNAPLNGDAALDDAISIVTSGTLDHARRTRSAAGLERVLAVHAAQGRVLSQEHVHEIHALAIELGGLDGAAADRYVRALRDRQPPLAGEELRQLRRIEALRSSIARRGT